MAREKCKPVKVKTLTFEEAFANSTSRLTLKSAAALLKVSKSTMRRLVAENKIFHYRLGKHYIIPTRAMEAYTKSNGKATWLEQAENVGKHETRIIGLHTLSLPVDRFEDATSQDLCCECNTNCWHCELTESCIEDSPGAYGVYCYKCAAEFEKNNTSNI